MCTPLYVSSIAHYFYHISKYTYDFFSHGINGYLDFTKSIFSARLGLKFYWWYTCKQNALNGFRKSLEGKPLIPTCPQIQ